jgi:tetratricopeptide (TPR) repeat protein
MRRELIFLVAAGCASALHEPPPVSALAPGHANGRSADELMRDGDAAWAQRPAPGKAADAQALYLDAANADEHRTDGLLGAMRVISWRIEREPGVARERLAEQEVQLGQWCERRAAHQPECDYRLAIGLGQQARERPSTGADALGKMVTLLQAVSAADPKLDHAGASRVLALLYLRAPAWPAGPGDNDKALEEAHEAFRLFPDAYDNEAVLGEAYLAKGIRDAAAIYYRFALKLATAAQAAGDPDAAFAITEARTALDKLGVAGP